MTKKKISVNVAASRIWNVAYEARKWLAEMLGGEEIERAGTAFGALEDDTELRADRLLGERFLEAFSVLDFFADTISIEGMGERRPEHEARKLFGPGVGLWYCIDPLDGSLNYRMRRGTAGLPYASCVTVLQRRQDATFGDIRCACIVDLRNGDWWGVAQGRETHLNHRPAHTLAQAMSLDLGSQIVIGEMYYPENREKLARAFVGKKGYLRSIGSAAYEMAMVANGTAVAFVCDRQKQHELGAGYALVKGAGGVAVDWDGKDLGPRAYDFKTQTPCVLAANAAIADAVLELLRAGG